MLANKKLILYVLDDGFYFFNSNRVSFENYIALDDEIIITEFIERLPKFSKVDIVLDLTDEEITVEELPNIYFWEKVKYKEILKLKNLDKRVDKLLIDYVDTGEHDFARIYKIFKNSNVSRLIKKLMNNQVFVLGVYSSSLFFESLTNSRYFNKYRKLEGFSQSLFVLRRTLASYKILYLKNKKLLLSRVVDFHEDVMNDEQRFDYITRETDMTLRYLANSKLINFSEHFRVFLIDDVNSSDDAEKKLNQAIHLNSEFLELDENNHDVFKILDAGNMCNEAISPIYYSWFVCALKMLKKPPRLPDVFADQVYLASLLSKLIFVTVFVFFILGSYYLGSLTSKYFFLDEKIDYLGSKVGFLKKMKSDLEKQIDIPYDARDLQKIVEFSERFPEVAKQTQIIKPIIEFSNLLDKDPEISLFSLSIQRLNKRQELLSGEYAMVANLFINRPSVLYQENLDKIYKFKEGLSHYFTDIVYLELPVEVDPSKSQNINDGMIMPASVPFSIKFRWKSQ